MHCKWDNYFSIYNQTACKSSHNISAHECALNQSTYSSTNNCSNRYQLTNNDLASLLQIKLHYMHCKWHNYFSISNQTACKSSHNISAHDYSLNQSTNSSTNNCSKKCQLLNHDLPSLLQIKQHYMSCKWHN